MAMQSTIRAIIIAPTIILFFTFCFRLVLLFLLFALVVEMEVNNPHDGDEIQHQEHNNCSNHNLIFTFCFRLVLLFLLLALVVEMEVNNRHDGDEIQHQGYNNCSNHNLIFYVLTDVYCDFSLWEVPLKRVHHREPII